MIQAFSDLFANYNFSDSGSLLLKLNFNLVLRLILCIIIHEIKRKTRLKSIKTFLDLGIEI